MILSERSKQLGTETAFQVQARIEELESQGKEISKFHIGQPDFRTPDNICLAAIKAITEGKHGYTPSAGIISLREAVAQHLGETRGIEIEPEHVVIDNGAKPFIHHVIACVTDQKVGHEIIYPVPGFPIYNSQIIDQGVIPIPWHMRKGKHDVNDLEDLITEKTRLVIISSPHNPCGYTFNREELKHIAQLVLKNPQLSVYSDEPYSGLAFDKDFVSLASIDQDIQKKTIVVDGPSKRYAMTGWRIGYAANEELSPYLTKRITNLNSCANHISQMATLEALTGSQHKAKEMKQEFKKRRNYLVERLNQIEGIRCPLPGGAFYAWPDVQELCQTLKLKDSAELQEKLLEESGVAVLADKHFIPQNTPYEGEHLRFAYTIGIPEIEKGLERLIDFIKKNKN